MMISRILKSLMPIAVLVGWQACSTQNFSTQSLQDVNTQLLLSGASVFGEEVQVTQPSLDEILAIDDEMRAYVDTRLSNVAFDGAKLRRLIQAMIDDGLLSLNYDANLSNSAIETFHQRAGNCLSFSNLFVALAREAGLKVSFQLVDIPPSFSTDGELILLNNHINVVVESIRIGPNFTREHVVDFNTAEYNGNYPTRSVSDNYVLALYHSNLAVEAMTNGDYRKAFTNLKQGINLEPGIAELWINLGVFYSRHDQYEFAIQAYQQALINKPNSKSALGNLANVYEHTGQFDLAEQYQKRVDRYQQRNPYYHYFLAKSAYYESDYELALQQLKTAIRMKNDEHQFYFLEGLSQLQLADQSAADASFVKARDTAQQQNLAQAYDGKLKLLRTNSQRL